MAIQQDTRIVVKRNGATLTISFSELKVGDTFRHDGECWFVKTDLVEFGKLVNGVVFRRKGVWFIKTEAQRFAMRLSPNTPFGKMTTEAAFGFDPAELVGSLSLEHVR